LLILKREQIIREVRLGENRKRYEIFPENHHHHLVCVDCGYIEDVDAEKDLYHLEKKIAQVKKFKVENHSLEFFGVCANCNH
jgi:Fur family ferric uptake transcriptional regulator